MEPVSRERESGASRAGHTRRGRWFSKMSRVDKEYQFTSHVIQTGVGILTATSCVLLERLLGAA